MARDLLQNPIRAQVDGEWAVADSTIHSPALSPRDGAACRALSRCRYAESVEGHHHWQETLVPTVLHILFAQPSGTKQTPATGYGG